MTVKKGDMCIVVKPGQCGILSPSMGRIITLGARYAGFVNCGLCGDRHKIDGFMVAEEVKAAVDKSRLVKIDTDWKKEKTEHEIHA